MNFTVNNKRHNINTLVRAIGYRYLEKNNNEVSMVKPLEAGGYPRFHLFLTAGPGFKELHFNLHLDQKKPVYEKARAHNADYQGEVLKEEAQRIKQLIENK